MEVTIEFTLEAFDCPADHMPKRSHIYTACRAVRMILARTDGQGLEMRCDESQVDVLLGIAKQHCPDAVQQIEEALAKSS
jgi:hypothetical protein